jgi:serine/threonine-protein kinase RsbT
MDEQPVSERLMGALSPYFSQPIAKALLGLSLRRAKVSASDLRPAVLPEVLVALERALPAYIADPGRRGDCVQGLRRLMALAPADARASNGAASGAAGEGSVSTVVHIRTADEVSNAAEIGRDLARRAGLLLVEQTKVATAISELARNILLYAKVGEVRITSLPPPRRGVEVTATDRGPGIADIAAVMDVTYRSRTGMGMGLKGAKRLMDFFEISSAVDRGTTVVVRKFAK